MILTEQIVGIIFSFCYGIILSILYNFNYQLIFNTKVLVKVVFNVVFVFDLVLIYFLVMKKINNAIILPYFYLFIILGFLLSFRFSRRFRYLFNNFKFFRNKRKDD